MTATVKQVNLADPLVEPSDADLGDLMSEVGNVVRAQNQSLCLANKKQIDNAILGNSNTVPVQKSNHESW